MRAPILEDCRLFLLQWAKQIKDPHYAITYKGQTHYAKFNDRGKFEFYNRTFGIQYLYEVPCDFQPSFSYDSRFFDVSYHGCDNLYFYLMELSNLPNLIQTKSPFHVRPFCFSYNWYQDFPAKVTAPNEFANYRIRASKFYYNTPLGRAFVSPTLAIFQQILIKELPVIDDGTPDSEYLYDYWD